MSETRFDDKEPFEGRERRRHDSERRGVEDFDIRHHCLIERLLQLSTEFAIKTWLRCFWIVFFYSNLLILSYEIFILCELT